MTRPRPSAALIGALLAVASTGWLAAQDARDQPSRVFLPARNLSNSPPYSQIDAVALDASQGLYVVWAEYVNDQLWLARSPDGGGTFMPPRLIVPPQEPFAFEQVDMTARGTGELHLAMTRFELMFGGAEILYLRSNDGGDTFAPPVQVSTLDAFNSVVPAIADGWGIAVAWEDVNIDIGEEAIAYSQSLDGGHTFAPPRRLSDSSPGGKGCPDVALAGTGTAYVVWTQGIHPNEDIYFSRSVDGGLTFSAPDNISNLAAKSWCPQLAADDSGTLVVVWAEGAAFTDRQVMTARSTDGGLTFSAPRRISEPGVDVAIDPQLIDSGNGGLMVTWGTGDIATGDVDCFVARSVDGGATFSAPVPIPGCGRSATRAARTLHVAFSRTPAGQTWPDVFYSRGDDIVFPVFWDVPEGHFARPWIEAVFKAGVTGGCGSDPLRYCPDDPLTRAQMAVFLLRSQEGPTYTPPPATGIFDDVPVADPFAPWIEELYRRSVTGGCSLSPLLYCPTAFVTRAQMSVFLLRTEDGPSYVPPPARGLFDDVPATDPFARWIEELSRRGITAGCSGSPPLYCPEQAATRGEMAVFLVRTFGLPL